MIEINSVKAEFLRGSYELETLPETDVPEIILVGRSNAGKSTLVNRLTKVKDLARVSATPGKTRQFNFFKIALTYTNGKRPETVKMHLVDLPGFGYAEFSQKRRESLQHLIGDYLEQREQLRVICLLNDCRREPKEEELAVRDLAAHYGRNLLVILTKFDKLKNSEKKQALYGRADEYGLEPEDLVISGEKIPAMEIWQRIVISLSM